MFQSARSICAQLPDVFRRHAELDGHHQHVVVGVVASVMSLDMPEHAFLQKPLHLSAVHGIASQTVNLPTNNALGFAPLNPLQHFVENKTSGFLRGAFFDKLLRDRKIFTLGDLPQFGELCFDGENLLILDISAFASVEEINHMLVVYYDIPLYRNIPENILRIMKSEQIKLGKNLKRIRTEKGISQGDIARALNVGRSFITNIENGKTNPTLATIARLARAVGISADELLK